VLPTFLQGKEEFMADCTAALAAAPLMQLIYAELDRLRALDWSTRPRHVKSALGLLGCHYEESLGTPGWVCLNRIVEPGTASESPFFRLDPAPRQDIRIWIPQPH
jgi:hypothetical protein